MIGKFLTGLDMPSLFLGWAFFASVGVFLSILLQTTKRDVPAPQTPVQFSWSFLWSDNSRRVYTAITVIYIALRFAPDLFGFNMNEYLAFGVGFGSDKLAQLIKDKTNILDKK